MCGRIIYRDSFAGRSHSPSYNLFSIGEFASNKLKHYAEHGDMNAIHAEGQDGHSILDSFTATPIQTGDGESTAIFLASTNHSQVSTVQFFNHVGIGMHMKMLQTFHIHILSNYKN